MNVGTGNQGGRAQHDFILAWLEEPDIAVKVDTARLETGRFKKGFVENVYYCTTLLLNSRVLLNFYCNGVGAAMPGCPVLSWIFEKFMGARHRVGIS
jgi:hypothetical protein